MENQGQYFEIALDEGYRLQLSHGKFDEFWNRYERGVWEPETQAVFRRFIDPQHSYVDIGAWIGPTLLIGSQRARRAYGFEPDPIAFAELTRNIELNYPSTRNVRLFNMCIVPVSGKVTFGSRGDGGDSESSLLFTDMKKTWTVNGINFQEWIDKNKVNDCNFIKIDIEGGEYKVIPSMLGYLAQHRPTILLSLHAGFLGETNAQQMVPKIKRCVLRVKETVLLLNKLRFYKYWYDPCGRLPVSRSKSFRSRLRHRLTSSESKSALMFVACCDACLGRFGSLVATDVPW